MKNIKINSKKQKTNLIFKNKQAALSMMYTKPVLKTNYVNLIQILSYIKKQINENSVSHRWFRFYRIKSC